MGKDWGVQEKLALLNGMNAIQQMLIVGIFSADRMQEYTSPGYKSYGRSLVEEVKPYIYSNFRTRPGPQATGVMGSSLGGVVSFYTGWQWPDVFGNVGCLSSTFTYKDNLVERVLHEERKDIRFYIDSGWPGDNYEVGWRWPWLWQSVVIVMVMIFCILHFRPPSIQSGIGASACICRFSFSPAGRP